MIKGFTELRKEDLSYYNGTGTLVQHERTGMKIFHFKPNKGNELFFNYVFTTPLSDDSGIAHALEHLVMQGSKKYPVKNMFFQLAKKALTKKLNALTSAYFTSFYAGSYIPDDYYRLLDVYGDSVFFPLLTEQAFNQEVWRFDLDDDGKPTINGVVYNEMSSQSAVSSHNFRKIERRAMYQGAECGFMSGGDFLEIPDLTREKLVDFHKKNYTPANCLLFLYGKLDLEEQLSFLEEKLLSRLPTGTQKQVIKDEIRPLPSLSEIKIGVPYKGLEEVTVELAVLCKDGTSDDIRERDFFFQRINPLLTKQLKFSSIGKFYVKSIGSPKNKYFLIGFEAVKKENIEEAKKVLLCAMENCLKDGMDYEELKAFCKKRDRDFKYPKSTIPCEEILEKIKSGYIEKEDPFEYISGPEEKWTKLKEKFLSFTDEDFNDLLQRYLVQNPNKVFVVRTPSKDYFEKIEAKRAEMISKKLAESERSSVEEIADDKAIFEKVLKEDDSQLVEKLFPALKIENLKELDDAGLAELDMVSGKYGPVHLFSSKQETDGKITLRIAFALDNLTQEEFQQLEWVLNYISDFGFDGIKKTECKTIFKNIGLGPVTSKFVFIGSDSGGKEIYENRHWLSFNYNFYLDEIKECLSVIQKTLYAKNFDDPDESSYANKKISESFKKKDLTLAEKFASLRTESYFSKNNKFKDSLLGLESLKVKTENSIKNIEELTSWYRKIYEKIINGTGILYFYCEEKDFDEVKQSVSDFIGQLEIKPLKENKLAYLNEQLPESNKQVSSIIIPISTGALVLKFRGSKYPSREYTAEKVLLTWFNRDVLYEELRKYHGAYHCSCSIDASSSLISISTNRDPGPEKSLEIIQNCLAKLGELESSKMITEEFVKGVALKKYAEEIVDFAPSYKGKISFIRKLSGHTPEQRSRALEDLLSLQKENFIAAGKRIAANSKNLKACIVTSEESKAVGDVVWDFREG